MGLLKPDLYRSFGIGFALGAVLVALQVGPSLKDELMPAAQAETVEQSARVR